MLVVNAANRERDFAWIRDRADEARAGGAEFELRDVSDDYALLALQGPRAVAILDPADRHRPRGDPLLRLRRTARWTASRRLISRTGYTGEDGFELYVAPGDAVRLWDRLLAAGGEHGLVPAGLGARDTLRLEAAMALYGHELDEETTPLGGGARLGGQARQGRFHRPRGAGGAAGGGNRPPADRVRDPRAGHRARGAPGARRRARTSGGSPAAPGARPARRPWAWPTCRPALAAPGPGADD